MKVSDILEFLLITRQDPKYKWVKILKVNWWNPLSWVVIPIGYLIAFIVTHKPKEEK